jgi:hypothetical protein
MGTCRPGRRVAGGRQGIGRFVYTPILPLMTAQAGLTPKAGASLATANYIGYLLGALAVTLEPRLVRSSMVHRGSLVLLVFTLAAMPLTHTTAGWFVLRLLAGIASAVVFVIVVNSLLSHLRDHPRPTSGMGAGRRRGRHRPVRRPSADAEPGGRHSNPPSRIDLDGRHVFLELRNVLPNTPTPGTCFSARKADAQPCCAFRSANIG